MTHGNHESPSRVLRARTAFFNHGETPAGLIDDIIARSWRRCAGYDIISERVRTKPYVTGKPFEELRDHNLTLLNYALPEMETLYEQIAHSHSMVILTDRDGVLLHSLGDPDFDTKAKRVALQPGACWSEHERGTNAIGTALSECGPVVVNGAEHYLDDNHFLTCSAVPVFDPLGRLSGVLDISGDYRGRQVHTLALVRMSATQIENRLFRGRFGGQILLRFHGCPGVIGTLGEGLAAFSPAGRLLAANRKARAQLDLPPGELPGYDFESLFDLSFQALLQQVRLSADRPLALHVRSGARVYAQVRPERAPVPGGVKTRARAPVPRSTPAGQGFALGDARIRHCLDKAGKALAHDIPVLVQGETGVGKEIFARVLHEAGPRRNGALVAVNCAAIPESLIESELFGYSEGAFTGARRKGARGKLLQAGGGTLFLDEIGDMPLALQTRLLRVLQDKRITPLGSCESIAVDFTLISASHQRLQTMVAQGEFRADLYYRLNGLQVYLPPLRERDDLDHLISTIMRNEHGAEIPIAEEAMEVFRRHPWPGNVRQLRNVLLSALAMRDDDGILLYRHLPEDLLDGERDDTAQANGAGVSGTLKTLACDAIAAAVDANQGNLSAAARALGISRTTVYRKLRQIKHR